MYSRIYQSPVGRLEIICDEHHVLSISFVKNSKPTYSTENELCLQTEKELSDYFEGKRQKFHLPLKFNGTVFQNKVWKKLCDIPYGETWSYKKLAESIGHPKAFRAVGNANNKNPLGIVVPCHRIIGSNGGMTGYVAGIKSKVKLLVMESTFHHHLDQDLHR